MILVTNDSFVIRLLSIMIHLLQSSKPPDKHSKKYNRKLHTIIGI